MRFLREKKVIVSFILGVVLASSIAVYATINANTVTYKNGKNVEEALDELYAKNSNNLYLYWKGNTYDSVTGGWETSITTNVWAPSNGTTITRKSAVFNQQDGYIDLSTDSTYQYVVANTKNKIDCTEYNYVNIWYSLTKSYCTLFNVESALNPTYYLDAPSRIYSRNLNGSNSFVITYPINCSEPGYISFSTLRGIASDTTTDLKIYGVYLSKKIGHKTKI